MRIGDYFASQPFGLSFEVFPPKTDAGREAMYDHVGRLAPYRPAFISCTYGAGGSTRDQTLDIVSEIHRRFGLATTAHLTCVGSTVGELCDWLARAVEARVPNIMALRGDPPKDQAAFTAVEGGLSYAGELVALIRTEFPALGIGVAGYPETHQEATDADADLRHLKTKVDAGADAVFTQLFFDNDAFWKFRDRCREAKIAVPVVPGILPIVNFAQIQRLTKMCKAAIPRPLFEQLDRFRDDPDGQFRVGVDWAASQCESLIRGGVRGIHFYVLNRSEATDQVLSRLKFPRNA